MELSSGSGARRAKRGSSLPLRVESGEGGCVPSLEKKFKLPFIVLRWVLSSVDHSYWASASTSNYAGRAHPSPRRGDSPLPPAAPSSPSLLRTCPRFSGRRAPRATLSPEADTAQNVAFGKSGIGIRDAIRPFTLYTWLLFDRR